MTTAIKMLANIFGASTFFMMFLGLVTVINGDNFGMQEITFLMFVFFVMTSLTSMGREKGKEGEEN